MCIIEFAMANENSTHEQLCEADHIYRGLDATLRDPGMDEETSVQIKRAMETRASGQGVESDIPETEGLVVAEDTTLPWSVYDQNDNLLGEGEVTRETELVDSRLKLVVVVTEGLSFVHLNHARADYAERIFDIENKIPGDEPVMLFRGKDLFFPALLEGYAKMLVEAGHDPYSEMVQAVLHHAEAAIVWQGNNVSQDPDIPEGSSIYPRTYASKHTEKLLAAANPAFLEAPTLAHEQDGGTVQSPDPENTVEASQSAGD